MFYNLDVPDYQLDPPREDYTASEDDKDSDYSDFLQEMDYLGLWVPAMGETYYTPVSDDVDCFPDVWHGYLDQMDLVREGLVFKTGNEALEKARKDQEVALYGAR